jgi:hypothetical protein
MNESLCRLPPRRSAAAAVVNVDVFCVDHRFAWTPSAAAIAQEIDHFTCLVIAV